MSNTTLETAIVLAAQKHAGQTRRDGTPYIYHPLGVAELLKNAGYGIDYQIAAIFHDLLEDTDTQPKELEAYGSQIVSAVQLLTRIKGMDENEYVADILQNPIAAAVKNADKIHNLYGVAFNGMPGTTRDESDKTWGVRYLIKSKKYYEKRFSPALDNALYRAEAFIAFDTYQTKEVPNYPASEMLLYTT